MYRGVPTSRVIFGYLQQTQNDKDAQQLSGLYKESSQIKVKAYLFDTIM